VSNKTPWKKGLLGFALAAACFLSTHCSEEPAKLAGGKVIYEFLANAANAQITAMNREAVSFAQAFTINNQKRAVLFEHPNAEVVFRDIAIPKNVVLQLGIGINPAVWDKPGDGVTFEVTAIDEKSNRVLIFSRYIDPKNVPDDRKWHDTDIDLKDFAGQTMSFLFSTTVGPRGNGNFDWAGWSSPKIRLASNG
jgi:hypothetical protein